MEPHRLEGIPRTSSRPTNHISSCREWELHDSCTTLKRVRIHGLHLCRILRSCAPRFGTVLHELLGVVASQNCSESCQSVQNACESILNMFWICADYSERLQNPRPCSVVMKFAASAVVSWRVYSWKPGQGNTHEPGTLQKQVHVVRSKTPRKRGKLQRAKV